jgi:alpha-tubulin suppressor-like RCC1 family protein
VVGRYNGTLGTYCWGYNASGQLGNGTTTRSSTPVLVSTLSWKSIAAGGQSTYAVDQAGNAYGWGNNTYGQLGDGTTSTRLLPTRASWKGLTQYQTAGASHSCTVAFDGKVTCYGKNDNGQLGDGTTTDSSSGVTVVGLVVKQLVSGGDSNCAISTGGATLCWGNNVDGEVGDYSYFNRLNPTPVAPTAPAFISLGAGTNGFCGITAGLDLYCWGLNIAGQLGDGTQNQSYQPVKAVLN